MHITPPASATPLLTQPSITPTVTLVSTSPTATRDLAPTLLTITASAATQT